MKTKLLFLVVILIATTLPFVARGMDPLMMETYRAEAIAMDEANECYRAIGSYSKFRCMLWTRNVKNGAVK